MAAVDRILDRGLARLGRRWFPAMWAAVLAVSTCTWIACWSVYTRFLGLDGATTLRALLAVAAVPPLVAVAVWRPFATAESDLVAWTAGVRDPTTARRLAGRIAEVPTRSARTFAGWVAALALPAGVLLLWALDELGVAQLVLYGCGLLFGGGYVVILQHLLVEVALRPVVRQLDDVLGAGWSAPEGTAPLARRLFLAMLGLSSCTGMFVGGLMLPAGAGPGSGLLVVATSAAFGLTFSLVLSVVLAATVLQPTDDLLEITRQVARGDLDARVSVVAAREHAMLAEALNAMAGGLQERERLRVAFGSYVDPAVGRRVLAGGSALPVVEVEVTVMFLDIRGFTAFAASRSAAEVVAFLDGFFALTLPVLRAHRGHPNKLLGDGFLAAFGAPEPLDDHADRAVAAGVALLEAIAERYGGAVEVGIGVNTGRVVAGTIGSADKLDYTLIGDAVNVAARVQALTRALGDPMLVTATTAEAVRGDVVLQPRGQHALRGRGGAVEVLAPARAGRPSPGRLSPPDSAEAARRADRSGRGGGPG
jgi:adenylate cyclase